MNATVTFQIWQLEEGMDKWVLLENLVGLVKKQLKEHGFGGFYGYQLHDVQIGPKGKGSIVQINLEVSEEAEEYIRSKEVIHFKEGPCNGSLNAKMRPEDKGKPVRIM